ncbi:HNH endonuclease [Myxococcus phage Mx9]|nr:HNH endonuclease [Myxococcus phage Mx9]
MRIFPAILVAMLVVLPPSIAASSDDALRGLEGVALVVHQVPQHAGISTAEVTTMAELALRRSGIRILTSDEAIKAPGFPVLYVSVDVGKPKDMQIYSVGIELWQLVMLTSNKKLIHATTWSTNGGYGVTPRWQIGSSIREMLEPQLERFCNEYLKANPHSKPVKRRPAVMDLVDPEPVNAE